MLSIISFPPSSLSIHPVYRVIKCFWRFHQFTPLLFSPANHIFPCPGTGMILSLFICVHLFCFLCFGLLVFFSVLDLFAPVEFLDEYIFVWFSVLFVVMLL